MNVDELYGYRKFRSGKMEFYYGQGQIRRVSLGTVQVVNSIYAAVRDRDWGTVPLEIREESVRETGTGISIDLTLAYSQEGSGSREEVAFGAEITIRIIRNQLVYSFEGSALTSFEMNRIGICVLHPASCGGLELEIYHPGGTSSKGRFPVTVSPHQPFFNIRGMKWKPSPDMSARLLFEGEIFEMEDQRNWSDSTFKTYSPPLEIPFPVRIENGTRIRQKVTLITEPGPSVKIPRQARLTLQTGRGQSAAGPGTTALRQVPAAGMPIPSIGISRPIDTHRGVGVVPDKETLLLLKQARFSHYRADLHLSGEWNKDTSKKSPPDGELARIRGEQKLMGIPVELVLHFGRNWLTGAEYFLRRFLQKPFPLESLVLLDDSRLSTEDMLRVAVPLFREKLPGVPLGGGTDAYFAELNRNRPNPDYLDFITYALCPQVHASDDLTLVENLQSHRDMVNSAKEFSGRPVSVSPVTLTQRFNPVAAEEKPGGSSIAGPADRRLAGIFGACWTLGCLNNLILSGTRSITLFEAAGPLGILGSRNGSLFPYPVYYILQEVLSGTYSHAWPVKCSDPLLMDALHMEGKKEVVLLVANYTGREQEIHISGSGTGIAGRDALLRERISGVSVLTGDGWKEHPFDGRLDPVRLQGPGIIRIKIKSGNL